MPEGYSKREQRYRQALEKIISICPGQTWQEEVIIQLAKEALNARDPEDSE